MLVLSRRRNETINIGSDIKITVKRVRGGEVRLGIEAPKDVRIVRGELDAVELTDVSIPGQVIDLLC